MLQMNDILSTNHQTLQPGLSERNMFGLQNPYAYDENENPNIYYRNANNPINSSNSEATVPIYSSTSSASNTNNIYSSTSNNTIPIYSSASNNNTTIYSSLSLLNHYFPAPYNTPNRNRAIAPTTRTKIGWWKARKADDTWEVLMIGIDIMHLQSFEHGLYSPANLLEVWDPAFQHWLPHAKGRVIPGEQ
jgi:hypothetical protein